MKRELVLNSVEHMNNPSSLFTHDRVMDNSKSTFTNDWVKNHKQKRKLILTLVESQIGVIGKNDIIQKFKEFDFVVEVAAVTGKPALSIIIFPDKESAKRAHDSQESIGFYLTFKRAPRPTRRYPWKFETLVRLDIRNRTSPYQIVYELKKGSVVTVDKIKSLLARIVFVENEGIVVGKIRGWVTLPKDDGVIQWKQLG